MMKSTSLATLGLSPICLPRWREQIVHDIFLMIHSAYTAGLEFSDNKDIIEEEDNDKDSL